MTLRHKKVLFAGLGLMTVGLLAIPILERLYANAKTFEESIDVQRSVLYRAAGIVGERARRGQYATYEEADTDFEFERIRLMMEEEEGINGQAGSMS